MKRTLIAVACGLAALSLVGCISAGSGPKTTNHFPTVGQQLIDLQKAKEAGAITEAEYQAQKAKFLGQ